MAKTFQRMKQFILRAASLIGYRNRLTKLHFKVWGYQKTLMKGLFPKRLTGLKVV